MRELAWLFLGACIGSAMIGGETRARGAELEAAKRRALDCVEERRTCGRALDWCQVTTKGTMDYVVDRLLGEGRIKR